MVNTYRTSVTGDGTVRYWQNNGEVPDVNLYVALYFADNGVGPTDPNIANGDPAAAEAAAEASSVASSSPDAFVALVGTVS